MDGARDWPRFRRAGGLGALLAVPLFFWMVTAGHADPLRAQPFGNFYDVQAHSLVERHWDIPADSVAFEGFAVDGKTYIYYGPVPAVLRMPVAALTHRFDGRLTQVSMLVAFVVALAFVIRLAWRIRGLVLGDRAVDRLELWLVGAFVFSIGAGSIVFFLASRAWVYHEAELWGAALALGAYDAIVALLVRPSTRAALWAGVWTALALLTRASVGAGPVVALAVVLTAVLLGVLGSRAGAGWQARSRWPARWIGLREEAATGRLVIGLVAATVVPVALYAYVNYSRFGSLFGLPLDKQVLSSFDEPRRRALDANGGSLFGLRFVPTQVLQILRPDALRPDALFPWLRFPDTTTVIGDARFDTIDWSSSIPASMPALTLLAVPGLLLIWRRAASSSLRSLRAPVVGAVAGGVITLTIAFVANRYISDFVPVLVLAGLVGLFVLVERAPAWWRGRRLRAALVALAALALVSLWINFSLAILYQRALDPAEAALRAGFIGFQVDVDEKVPGGPYGDVRTGVDLPDQPVRGELFVLGRCEGLYWSDGRDWHPIERANGAGRFRLRVRFPSRPRADIEPLVSIGDGERANVVSVEYGRDGTIRFVVDSAVADAPLRGEPVHIDVGREHRVDVLADQRTGITTIALDGEKLDGLDTNAYFLAGGSDFELGAAPGAPARFSGTITNQRLATPLCESVRSRARSS